MPIIARVGRRSPGTRTLVAALYLLLVLGAVTMVYPFLLMTATATTGNADWRAFRIVPRYWFDRLEQFRKVVVDKGSMDVLAFAYGREDWFSPEDITGGDFAGLREMNPTTRDRIDRDYAAFMAEIDPNIKHLHFLSFGDRQHSVISLRTVYFDWLQDVYDDDLDRVNRLYDDTAEKWSELGMLSTFVGHWEARPLAPRHTDWRRFVASRSSAEQRLRSMDELVFTALRKVYGTVDGLNRTEGTAFASLFDVRWSNLPDTGWARSIRDRILRRDVPLAQLRLRATARPAFKAFIATEARTATPFTSAAPTDAAERTDWVRFVRSEQCLLDYFDPVDPRQLWQGFLSNRYRDVEPLNAAYESSHTSFDQIPLPTPVVDFVAFERRRSELLCRFLFGNFVLVTDVVWRHGRALGNTLIFVLLAIGTTLIVNPMAAYVLSRHDLRFGPHILIFLLATMAFPVEMVMIPNFLLIKHFPLGAILLGGTALVLFLAARTMFQWRLPWLASVTIGTAVATAAAWWLPPLVAGAMGREDLNVSLMNSFFALVLPGVVNGYWIFLLKGFFDSLPSELYEAGMLDGASESRMFRSITLPMSQPVLAVIALSAFTTAYGAFMFAFLTCQDPQMWTLMVFLYQFQQQYGVPQIMASLVIAAVPTLVVFVLCQRVILRGIVVPSFG